MAARAFLTGTDTSPLDELEMTMRTAAAAEQFERAAMMRDRLESLRWLSDQLERLRQVCERHSFVYPVHGHDGALLWYLVHGGRVVAVTPVPDEEASSQQAAAALAAVYREKRGALSLPRPEEMDGVFLVSSWFRRHPEERGRILEPQAARMLCEGYGSGRAKEPS
jgi:excinuclease UvrABC nuclease subunit